ncbi:MAG TPA: sugar ABC transporter ATP-binding protein [Oceanithermus profundus]|uniref:Sugar ABC transporter ATP-binding protein n=1 Tax=Oceanithermus profundus TaxID=187137 RepID=A0A7C4ZHP8_9DEIN|nr:sugar ABC transporter ATP-binding protein [Oceanithermus profundus]
MKPTPVLETLNLTKVFPGVVALDDVSLSLFPGEVLGLVGENGAGKSTLMKLIGGVYPPTRGRIRYKGEEVQFRSPKDALDAGISIVYQELNLIPHLSVAENIFINRLPRRGTFVNWARLYRDTERILEESGMSGIDPRAIVGELPIGVKQSVEIAKALSYDAQVLLLDEPTSSLTGPEIDNLFSVIRKLQERGIGIVYVSHHLDEIFEVTDRVHVLRDGKTVEVMDTASASEETLVARMVGRDLEDIYYKGEHQPGEVALEARGIGDELLDDVSFKVRRREVVGIYGLLGSGRTELLKSIVGARPRRKGEVFVHGKKVRFGHPQEAARAGVIYSSEDRKGENLFFGQPIWKNETYLALQIGRYTRFGFTQTAEERRDAEVYSRKLGVKAPSIDVDVYHLSGGNQQKVCLAKALINDPDVVLLDEPTRGIDVGAKLEIYKLIAELADQGKAVVFVSSELPEIIGCADRVYTMAGGRITAELTGDDINEENVLRYCLQTTTPGVAAS